MILFKRLSLFLIYLLLVGCAANIPEKLGISDLEWESYSPSKQKALLANYERLLHEWEKSKIEPEEKKVRSGSFLMVSIYDGQVMFPPTFLNWQGYQRVHFNVFKDECSNVEIKSLATSEVKTQLSVCFRNNTLYLDSSRFDPAKKDGTATIHYSPLWLHGFAYKEINSSGYAKLNNVTVEVMQKEMIKK